MQGCYNLVFRCALGILALLLVVESTSAQNILENPGFETGDLTGWLVAGAGGGASASVQSGDNGPSQPGTFSAFLDNQSEAANLTLKQTTPVGSAVSGTVFYSFDLRVGQAAEGGVFFVEIFAEQSGVGIIGTTGILGNFTPADWTAFDGSFEAPAGTDFLTIQLSAITGAVSGSISSMSVDNVSLAQTPIVPVEPTSWSSVKDLYALHVASPNPFNPATRLRFDMTESGHAALVVYDASGRRVATLIDGRMSAGSHVVPFNADNLASGAYFYELRTNGYREVRKMTLLK